MPPSKATALVPIPTIIQPYASTSKPDPAFICTICWQPQHAPSRPKLLGTSARIVCRACWRAVLDLSICWVCGECIVRGDEVVSLGWCFWHWGCFGCLICGAKMDVPAPGPVTQGEGPRWGSWDMGSDAGKRRRCVGVELNDIPLCGVCGIETAGETQGQVLRRGLEAVDRFDGGLSRDRLDMLSNEGPSDFIRSKRRKLQSPRQKELSGLRKVNRTDDRHSGESLLPFASHAADMGISEDGSNDETHCHSDTELAEFGPSEPETRPEVYVSIFDPVGEPAFQPSKTKPLPKWMRLLPNNVHREREMRRKCAKSEDSTHSQEMISLERNTKICEGCQKELGNEEAPSVDPTTRCRCPAPESPSAPLTVDIPGQLKRQRASISFDPGARRDTKSDYSGTYRRSQTTESAYMTPEYPKPVLPVPARQRTPFPRLSRPSLERSEPSNYFSHSINTSAAQDPSEDSSCAWETTPEYSPSPTPALKEIGSESFEHPKITAPQSYEYIDKYHPTTPEPKIEKYVAQERVHILEKIRRQKMAEAVEGKNVEAKVPKLKIEDNEVDPRREKLKNELRTLFREH